MPDHNPAAHVREQMRTKLAEQPRSLYELLREFDNVEYRTLLQAWGALRADCTLIPDDKGRYRLG